MTKPNNSVSRRCIKISQVFFFSFIKNSVDKKQTILLTIDGIYNYVIPHRTRMRKSSKIALVCEDLILRYLIIFYAITTTYYYISHPLCAFYIVHTHKKLKLILIKQNLIHFGEKVFNELLLLFHVL